MSGIAHQNEKIGSADQLVMFVAFIHEQVLQKGEPLSDCKAAVCQDVRLDCDESETPLCKEEDDDKADDKEEEEENDGMNCVAAHAPTVHTKSKTGVTHPHTGQNAMRSPKNDRQYNRQER